MSVVEWLRRSLTTFRCTLLERHAADAKGGKADRHTHDRGTQRGEERCDRERQTPVGGERRHEEAGDATDRELGERSTNSEYWRRTLPAATVTPL